MITNLDQPALEADNFQLGVDTRLDHMESMVRDPSVDSKNVKIGFQKGLQISVQSQ